MTRTELVDEFSELHRRVQLYKPDLDRYEKLKKNVLALVDEKHPAAEPFVIGTKSNQVQISPCAQQSRITSIQKIWQRAGSVKFLHACTLTLKAARDLVPSAEEDGLIVTEQNGPRRITGVVSKKAAS